MNKTRTFLEIDFSDYNNCGNDALTRGELRVMLRKQKIKQIPTFLVLLIVVALVPVYDASGNCSEVYFDASQSPIPTATPIPGEEQRRDSYRQAESFFETSGVGDRLNVILPLVNSQIAPRFDSVYLPLNLAPESITKRIILALENLLRKQPSEQDTPSSLHPVIIDQIILSSIYKQAFFDTFAFEQWVYQPQSSGDSDNHESYIRFLRVIEEALGWISEVRVPELSERLEQFDNILDPEVVRRAAKIETVKALVKKDIVELVNGERRPGTERGVQLVRRFRIPADRFEPPLPGRISKDTQESSFYVPIGFGSVDCWHPSDITLDVGLETTITFVGTVSQFEGIKKALDAIPSVGVTMSYKDNHAPSVLINREEVIGAVVETIKNGRQPFNYFPQKLVTITIEGVLQDQKARQLMNRLLRALLNAPNRVPLREDIPVPGRCEYLQQ